MKWFLYLKSWICTFRYAVERINHNKDILPKTRLSAQIEKIPPRDSFHASKRGKEVWMYFLKFCKVLMYCFQTLWVLNVLFQSLWGLDVLFSNFVRFGCIVFKFCKVWMCCFKFFWGLDVLFWNFLRFGCIFLEIL